VCMCVYVCMYIMYACMYICFPAQFSGVVNNTVVYQF